MIILSSRILLNEMSGDDNAMWNAVKMACIAVHEGGDIGELEEYIQTAHEDGDSPRESGTRKAICTAYLGSGFGKLYASHWM